MKSPVRVLCDGVYVRALHTGLCAWSKDGGGVSQVEEEGSSGREVPAPPRVGLCPCVCAGLCAPLSLQESSALSPDEILFLSRSSP